jgi:23S rRNA (uridine2552-2'-O)-methyltransferase
VSRRSKAAPRTAGSKAAKGRRSPEAPQATSGRSKSSARWLNEHFSDPFVQRAHAEGWRSRAVFKLEEVDRREKLLLPGAICLDLGAAPGAWSQYARRRLGRAGRVVAIDILPMEPLAGVEFLQGDFREEEVFNQILAALPERQVDLVLSDMAPSLSGIDVIDQPRSMYLAELALDMAARVLKGGGSALIKVFQGTGFQELIRDARSRFAKVKLVKPAASRARSPEMYLLAKDFRLV